MTPPVDRLFLDATSLSGCGVPGCTHSTHTFYLHARCHIAAPVKLAHQDGVLEVRCAECGKLILHILAPKRVPVYACRAHGAFLEASYTYGTGVIKVACQQCKKVLGQFVVPTAKEDLAAT